MPNRIIKESIRTSKTVNKMTDFQFRMWVYLITYVDDYGRGSADPELIKGFVFPRRTRLTESDIKKTLAELAGMGCINLYDVDGESFFYFPNWGEHQRIQTKKSKFPEPQSKNDTYRDLQNSTVGHGESPPESNPIQSESESKSESKSERARGAKVENRPDLSRFSPFVGKAVANWISYKAEKRQSYKGTGLEMLLNKIEKQVSLYGETAVVGVIEESMANNWQGIAWGKLEKSTPKRLRPEDIEL